MNTHNCIVCTTCGGFCSLCYTCSCYRSNTTFTLGDISPGDGISKVGSNITILTQGQFARDEVMAEIFISLKKAIASEAFDRAKELIDMAKAIKDL